MSRQTGHCRRFTFSLVTIVLCLDHLVGLASSLDCHCLNGNLGCDQSNGFCPSGCEKGWFGPGCQVASRLGYFYILYTNDTSSSPPSPDYWTTFAYEPDHLEGFSQKSYTTKSLAIGRRVAVYISSQRPANTENILTLCEVYVYGYRSLECGAGFTGPGCLLRGYDSNICRTTPNTTLGDFGGCNFAVCPENANLPPDCWITIPSFKNVAWNAEAACDYIHVTAQSLLSIGNRIATTIFISISPNGSSENSRGQCFGYESLKYLDAIIPVPLYQAYYVSLTPLICPMSIGGYNESTGKCVNIAGCQVGVSSPTKVVRTNSSRTYSIRSNGSCILPSFRIPSRSCGAPVSLSLICFNGSVTMPQDIKSNSVLCGLSNGRNYSCTILARLQNNLTENFTTDVFMPTSVSPGLDSTAAVTLDTLTTGDKSQPGSLTATIAGSLAGLVSLVAITVGLVTRSLRQRQPHSANGCDRFTACNKLCFRRTDEKDIQFSTNTDFVTYSNFIVTEAVGPVIEATYEVLQRKHDEDQTYATLNFT